MKRIVMGNHNGRFMFRSSRPGVDALTMTPGDDAILHEDQRPVAAIRSGIWASGGNDRTSIAAPELRQPPYQILMNPGDGTPMHNWTYYAVWEPGTIRLINQIASARRFAWAVLADVEPFDREQAIRQVTRLYHTILGRPPDGPGLRHWVDAMERGLSLDAVAAEFRKVRQGRT